MNASSRRIVRRPFPTSRGLSSWWGATVACAVLLGTGLTGCRALVQQHPIDRTVDADSERILWTAMRTVIYKEKFPVGGGADPATREIRSGWKLDLAPFKGDGFRTRVIASYAPGSGDRKGVTSTVGAAGLEPFDVTIRVEKETNESLSPLNLDRAKWTPADDDKYMARKLMQDLASLLGTGKFELEEPESPFGIE